MASGDLKVMQLSLELAKHRVKQVIRAEFSPVLNSLDSFDARFRAAHVCEGHGTVEGYHRRIIHLNPLVIEGQDSRPIGGVIVVGRAMAGRDACLKMIFAQLVSGGGLAQMKNAARDHSSVPIRTILFFESKYISLRIHSRGQPGAVQQH